MPPKKIAATKGDASEDNSGKFSWTIENERKLLLYTHPFTTVSTPDAEKLLEHFPGTNINGIKIRYSRLRVEKNKLAGAYGLAGVGGTAATGDDAKDTSRKRAKKRGAAGDEDGTARAAKKGKKGRSAGDKIAGVEGGEGVPGIKDEEDI